MDSLPLICDSTKCICWGKKKHTHTHRCNELAIMPQACKLKSLPIIQEVSLYGNPCCYYDDSRNAFEVKQIPAVSIQEYDPPCQFAPRLFIGSYATTHSRISLEQNHITHIITLGARLRPVHPELFHYLVVDVEDKETSNIVQHFPKCFSFITSALAESPTTNVLIHWFVLNKQVFFIMIIFT